MLLILLCIPLLGQLDAGERSVSRSRLVRLNWQMRIRALKPPLAEEFLVVLYTRLALHGSNAEVTDARGRGVQIVRIQLMNKSWLFHVT